jgi:hypothetical protein
MRKISALIVFAIACTPANAEPLHVDGPAGILDAAPPGDSLRYTVTGPAVAGATSYVWTVTAAPGVWGGLPSGVVTVNPLLAFTAIAPAAWDSVTFTATFQGKSTSRSSNILATTWKLRRALLATGPLVVDSSAVGPISLEVRPSTAFLAVGDTRQLCAFWRFGSGHVVMRTVDAPLCLGSHTTFFTISQRAVTPAEQGWFDAACDWPACLLGVVPRSVRTPADAVYVRRS